MSKVGLIALVCALVSTLNEVSAQNLCPSGSQSDKLICLLPQVYGPDGLILTNSGTQFQTNFLASNLRPLNSALARQSAGHSNLLAVLTPNVIAKPATVLITKVTIKGAKQAVQMFGPAQYAVAKAVADCVAAGTIPIAQAEDLVIVCGVFIHWQAEDNAKILKYNYEATKLSIERAMKNLPTPQEIVAQKDTAKHPFA